MALSWIAGLVVGVVTLSLSCQGSGPNGRPIPPAPAAASGGDVIPNYPDLRGTWTAVLQSIYTGKGPHTLDPAGDAPLMDYLRLTIIIDVQTGRLFSGTIRSAAEEEPVVGAFRDGGRQALYITRTGRGQMWFDPVQPGVVEICGGRGTQETLLALCGQLERASED